MKTTLLTIASLALLTLALPTAAQAQPADQRTTLTFNNPVEIPGRVLPAGRYEFRLADDGETADVVQVLKDNKVIGTYLTVPTDRLENPGTSFVTFEHTVAGAPPAIRAWFYPGNSTGEEFVYPKDRAVALARAAQAPVKATSDTMTAHMNAQEPAAQQQAVAALKDAPVQEARPAGDRVDVVEAELIQMPKTASALPTDVGAGVMLILLGIAVPRIGRLALAA